MNSIYKLVDNKRVYLNKEDLSIFNQYDWHLINKKGTYYVASQNNKGKTIYLARLIMKAEKGTLVDHKNGDTLDNTRENLRLCTKTQNAQNMKPNKNTTSKYKGVCWDKFRQKWRVNIKVNNKQTFLGRFDCENEAAIQYNKYATLYYGEFARLNKVEES